MQISLGMFLIKKKEEKNRTEDIWMCSFIHLGETLDILEWLQQIKGNKENFSFSEVWDFNFFSIESDWTQYII